MPPGRHPCLVADENRTGLVSLPFSIRSASGCLIISRDGSRSGRSSKAMGCRRSGVDGPGSVPWGAPCRALSIRPVRSSHLDQRRGDDCHGNDVVECKVHPPGPAVRMGVVAPDDDEMPLDDFEELKGTMRSIISRVFVLFAFASLVSIGPGCSDGPRLVTANGVVTLDGKPLEGATLSFIPLPVNAVSTAGMDVTGPDGGFQLSYYGLSGVAPGKYRVLVSKTRRGSSLIKKIDPVFAKASFEKQLMGLAKETIPPQKLEREIGSPSVASRIRPGFQVEGQGRENEPSGASGFRPCPDAPSRLRTSRSRAHGTVEASPLRVHDLHGPRLGLIKLFPCSIPDRSPRMWCRRDRERS